ncbi:MAG: hypothetical protein ACM3JD_06215, partial [Rudaea sp.]
SGNMPTATPRPSATSTATASPTLAPTQTPLVVPQLAPVRPSATRVPPTPTFPPTLAPTNTPTITNTPTETRVPTDTPRPRRAIPMTGGSVDSSAGWTDASGGSAPRSFDSGMIVLIGSVGLIGVSGLGLISLGAFIALRVLTRPSARAVRR